MPIAPKVSILLPVYNAESSIIRSVESILTQSFRNFELLIIDDGSTDNTVARIESCQDQRVKLIKKRHRGIVSALNAGLKVASTRFIARMDADDYAHPVRIEAQYKYLNRHPKVDLVGSCVQYKGNIKSNYGYFLYVQSQNKILDYNQIWNRQFSESPFAHPSVMFRTHLVEKFGPYLQGDFPEDYEIWLRWLAEGVKMEKLPDILLGWHDGKNRLSRSHPRYEDEGFFRIKSFYFSQWYSRQPAKKPVWIWGAGKVARRRVAWLTYYGIPVEGYIDVKSRPASKYRTIAYESFNFDCGALVLIYVSDRKGKCRIIEYLNMLGKTEGKDFWLMV